LNDFWQLPESLIAKEQKRYFFELTIKDNQSGAKFVLKKAGLWKIDISVDKKPFTSFIIRAK